MMSGARLRGLCPVGLSVLALAAMAPVHAQTQLPPPPAGVQNEAISATVPPQARGQTALGQARTLNQGGTSDPAGGGVAQAVPPVPGQPTAEQVWCSCGQRHGLSRWWWHRTQCKRYLQECALGFPEEFNEWPLGSALYAHGRTQVGNGNAARMVFYHYDFVEGSGQLNVRGRDKLAKIGQLLPATFYPVVIERTPTTPGLDEQRRATILAQLSASRFPVPPERVLIGPPIAAGLTGFEAIIVYGNQIGALQSGGAGGVGGYAGTAGLTAGGISGSAVSSGAGAGGGLGR